MNARGLSHVAIVAAVCIVPVSSAAQTPATRQATRPAAAARLDAAKLYRSHCAACHGKNGEGTPMGRPLAAPLMNGETVEAISEMLRSGVEGTPMVSFSKRLSAAQIEVLAKYVAAMKR